MILLSGSRNRIAGVIHDALPSLKTCEPHGGRFDLAELKRWGIKAPAVLVAITSTGAPTIGQGIEAPVAYVIYVITKDTAVSPRDMTAINLVQGILRLLPGQDWSHPEMGDTPFLTEPEGVTCQNLFSTDLDSEGVAMWAVTFRQSVLLSDTTTGDFSELDAFLRFSGEAANENDNVAMGTYGEFELLEANNLRITEEQDPLITSDGYYRETDDGNTN